LYKILSAHENATQFYLQKETTKNLICMLLGHSKFVSSWLLIWSNVFAVGGFEKKLKLTDVAITLYQLHVKFVVHETTVEETTTTVFISRP